VLYCDVTRFFQLQLPWLASYFTRFTACFTALLSLVAGVSAFQLVALVAGVLHLLQASIHWLLATLLALLLALLLSIAEGVPRLVARHKSN
jgi:hypothetical protein